MSRSHTGFNDVITTNEIECEADTNYSFFHSFDYTWFELIGGQFHLLEDHLSTVGTLFSSNELITLTALSLQIQDGYIVDLFLTVAIGETTYDIDISITDIDDVSINVPEVG